MNKDKCTLYDCNDPVIYIKYPGHPIEKCELCRRHMWEAFRMMGDRFPFCRFEGWAINQMECTGTKEELENRE